MDADDIINQLHELGVHEKVKSRRPGRPKSIPPEFFDTILQLYKTGLGYRSITTRLRGVGVSTTHTAVRRVIKGEGAYTRLWD